MLPTTDQYPAGRAAILLRSDNDRHAMGRWRERWNLTADEFRVEELDLLIDRLGNYMCLGFVGLEGIASRNARRLLTSAFRADVDVWTADGVYITDTLHEINDIECEMLALSEHLDDLPMFFSPGCDEDDENHQPNEPWCCGAGEVDQWVSTFMSFWRDEYLAVLNTLMFNQHRLRRISRGQAAKPPIWVDLDKQLLFIRDTPYSLQHELLPPLLDQLIKANGFFVSAEELSRRCKALELERRIGRVFKKLGRDPARYFESTTRGFRLRSELLTE